MQFDMAADIHDEQITMLRRLAKSDDFPHILLYGPSGAGKRTLIKCLLKELYQSPYVSKVKCELKEFKTGASGSTTVECIVYSSNYHIEVTPSDADNNDKVIVQKLIKEVASSQQLDTKTQKTFKVIVIHEMDKLTKAAQAALRRTMETYMPFCRIVAHCESLSKIIPPVKSRCLQVRVPAPSDTQVVGILSKIAAKEQFELPEKLAADISVYARRNLRIAIMMLQTAKLKHPGKSLPEKTYVPCREFESYAKSIAKDTIAEQSPRQLKNIRPKLYDLLTKGIAPELIFQVLVREFLRPSAGGSKMGGCLVEHIKPEVLNYACIFEQRCYDGSKSIMHLEAFLARVMALQKKALTGA